MKDSNHGKEGCTLNRFVIVVLQIAGLYGLYLTGSWIQQVLGLFIPGSVIGMLLLFVLLSLKIVPERLLQQGVAFMIRHLPFFFIPATVGIISYAHVFKGKGLLLIAIGLFSTAMVMAVSGRVTQTLVKRREEA
ncbi:CidA/LrgA family holin-like protein [Halobacillus litoralis]|uniref:CidA/LrgA family holin-like protein n=1 Tax=Halobacillus litoralis TaxID=45668 RepID=A0A845DUT4_9BACI|nr:CidA/LrgA family holin-like protein [Halobacillus litoralis]MYL29669.1 CidA/LrgA family holin-like protein [Halobacillus halophilus]MYL36886.1 CidA/LrgA family holin-like protein [Halobacillus litoralis]